LPSGENTGQQSPVEAGTGVVSRLVAFESSEYRKSALGSSGVPEYASIMYLLSGEKAARGQ